MKKLKLICLLFVMFFLACEDFLTGPLLDQNPNEVDDVSVVSPEALLVGSQVTICVRAVEEGSAVIFPERRSAFGLTLKNLQVSFRSKGIRPGKSNLIHFSENQL